MTATGSTLTAGRTPSVSELQAALLAARTGQFATPNATTQRVAAALATPPAASSAAPPPPPAPAQPVGGGTGVWLLGTHGGSGVRCLAAVLAGVLPGTRCAGKTWPAPQTGRTPVVLVCRGSHRGLSSAQEYARAYRDSADLAGRLRLLGVIVSADAPGRTPTPLRRLERLLSGAVPILGHVPWEPDWRIGPPPAAPVAEPLPWVAEISKSLGAALAAATAVAG